MYLYTYVSQELMKNTMNLRVRRNIWESLEEGKKEINDINIFKTQKHKKYFFKNYLVNGAGEITQSLRDDAHGGSQPSIVSIPTNSLFFSLLLSGTHVVHLYTH